MVRPAAFATICSCLLATALAAQDPNDPAGDPARDALADHARGLLALGEKALDDHLVNDALRLLRTAERCDAGVAGADELESRIDAARLASASTEGRDAVKAFWKSPASAAALQRLREGETALRERSAAALAAIVRRTEDPAEVDAVVRLALGHDLTGEALTGAVGEERMARLRAEHDKANGIERLELGAVVIGSPVDHEVLRGKVVLWRSFSL